MADERTAGGRSWRGVLCVGGTDEEGMIVGGTSGLACGLCGAGKDGESTIIENADFPVTKLEDEAGSDKGFHSYT